MTELTLALGVLALFVTIVTLAVVRGQLTANTQRADRLVSDTLDRLVERAALEPFPQLLDNSFTKPESDGCDDPAQSCPEVFGRPLQVTWSVESGGNGDEITDTVDWVSVTAETEWNGTTFRSATKVAAPTPNWREGWGAIRVVVTTLAADPNLQLYLVDTTTGRSAASSAAVTNGVAWLSAPLDLCGPSSAGCTLALGPYGATSTETVALDAVSALNTIRVQQDQLTETSAVLRPIGTAKVALYATNGAGERAAADQPGSVCLWVSFNDGADDRNVAYCNSEQAAQLTLDTYQPNPSRPWVRLPLPTGVPLTLSTDNPAGGCATPAGTVSWDGNAWISGGTCTSWTWGKPALLRSSTSDSTFEGSEITLDAGTTRYEAVWTTSGGVPAAGGPSLQPLWAKPRDVDLISSGTTCPAVNPHCRSGSPAAPVLTSPRVGAGQVAAVTPNNATSADFTLTVTDYDQVGTSATLTATLSATALGGATLYRLDTVTVDGQPTIVETALQPGDTIGSTNGSTLSIPMRVHGVTTGYRTATFTLSGAGGVRSTPVVFSTSNVAAKMFTEPVDIEQGTTSTLRVTVWGNDGQPASAVAVSASSLPTGATINAGTTDSAGVVDLPVSVTTTAAGSHQITLTAAGLTATGLLSVIPRAGSFILAPSVPDPVVIGQGATTTFEFTVKDLAGAAMPSTPVFIWATSAGSTRTGDVYSTTRGCESSATGVCEVTVAATAQAATGSYQLNLSSGAASRTVTLEVEPTEYRVSAPLLSITQSGEATLTVTVLDGTGQPVPGVTVTAAPTSGLTITPAVTNSSGVASLPVSAASNATSGLRTFSLTAGAAAGTATARVRQKVVNLSFAAATVTQGGLTRVPITALDASAAPVPGAVIEAVSGDGLVLRAGPADSSGVVTLTVEAPVSMLATSYLVSLSVGGTLIDVLPVRVQRGVGTVTSSGTLTRGSSSTITLQLRDLQGQNIAARPFTVESLNNAVKVGATQPAQTVVTPYTATTGADGSAAVPVYVGASATTGPTQLRIVTGGRTFNVYVQITSGA